MSATNAIYDHLRKFGLLMHVGTDGKRSKTEAMYCPARNEDYGDGNTSDLVLDCGGTVSFTEKFVYLGSLLHRDLTDKHGVGVFTEFEPPFKEPIVQLLYQYLLFVENIYLQ